MGLGFLGLFLFPVGLTSTCEREGIKKKISSGRNQKALIPNLIWDAPRAIPTL